jgi:hypothetical protein
MHQKTMEIDGAMGSMERWNNSTMGVQWTRLLQELMNTSTTQMMDLR